jgi:hypothetical protein
VQDGRGGWCWLVGRCIPSGALSARLSPAGRARRCAGERGDGMAYIGSTSLRPAGWRMEGWRLGGADGGVADGGAARHADIDSAPPVP